MPNKAEPEYFFTECCEKVFLQGDTYRERLMNVFRNLPPYPVTYPVGEVFVEGENGHQHLVLGPEAATDLLVLSEETEMKDKSGETSVFASILRNNQEIGLVGVLKLDDNRFLVSSLTGVGPSGVGPYLADTTTFTTAYRQAIRDLVNQHPRITGKWLVEDEILEKTFSPPGSEPWKTTEWLQKDIRDNPGRPVSFRLWRG